MTELFKKLDEDKKKDIIEGAIEEFAQYGYENSSTNRMVRKIGISKGSLFKYFSTKEELYLYIIDHTVNQVAAKVTAQIETLPKDLLERVERIARIEFAIYYEMPNIYNLFKRAFIKDETDIYDKIRKKYTSQSEDLFIQLLEGIETEGLKWDEHTTMEIIKWVLKGFNEDFFHANHKKSTIEDDLDTYIKGLHHYLDMVKTGLYK